jgi:hypothetical protein
MSSGGPPSSAHAAGTPAVPPSVRAQLLATEHWSLLATRSLTWSEVMSRITIYLTVASASLVVLALVVQTSGFGTAFQVLSIGLSAVVLLLGTLTGVRVHNASQEDEALLIGMNRLRAAYVEMDPAIADYLVASVHDDQAGIIATYTMGVKRSLASHVFGSTAMFVNMVNAIVAGALGALIAHSFGAGSAVVAVTGAIAGLAYLGMAIERGRRMFAGPIRSVNSSARFPTTTSARPKAG